MSAELKPGQKYPTPTRGFGDRVFYETLLKQNPSSVMAQEWCVNYGVLNYEDASKLHKIIMKRKGKPIKSTSSPGRNSNLKKKKRVKAEPDEAVDVGLNADGGEGIGMVAM
mmetsp:Transcript_9984/g.12591  ORF Transcript_9984/g.12591 Transcript_9984/m.12591 type:complete len:111 (-) Transcript_9984:360-692(-)|eukprot:CAMPEP_0203657734 /NCGR_PEP_ID=MMETSP0088-20131115/45925_1 /ASSEMBLY_ACC=CAM_ASM_001087 /TAXON_ID=426623 /ORGANISM="Chaetoceros affinis, Strain CCMP159" /LENGTH=110 /DNA_ID=CAMNT_0050519181 /DNA_START=221 /DNA_END=553 /DNA_ORIENTATION=-